MFKRKPDHILLAVAALLYTPFLFMGYGSDVDTYGVLLAGRHFAQTFDYVPSRGPGFFVFESITFLLDQIGGSFLTNLAVMGMALAILYCFMRLCREYGLPNYRWLCAALMVHPFFWANAACTMDYLFAVGFVFIGMIQIRRGRYFTAGAAFALGAGSRLTIALLAGCFMIWQFILEPSARKKLVQTGLVFGLATVIFYLPPAHFAQWTPRFLVATVGGQEYWSPLMRAGRWGYKNLMFWTIPGFILLAGILIFGAVRTRLKFLIQYKCLPLFALVTALLYEFFYMGIPTEPSYLIPTIPLALIAFSAAVGARRWPAIALTSILLAGAFVNINIARPDLLNRATSAQYGLWLERGHLLELTDERLNYQLCNRPACNVSHGPIIPE
jgi:hypothetical protein